MNNRRQNRMNRSFRSLVSLAMIAVLAACGGGDGGSTTPQPVAAPTVPPVVAAPTTATAIAVKSTSYENAKAQGLTAFTLPQGSEGASAYARADFKGNGTITLFTATLHYDPYKPQADSVGKNSTFDFWSQNPSGAWVKEASMIDNPVGCLHPRKAIVADFNDDSKPDVMVACTGYDDTPFPGEQNYMVLSTATGVFKSQVIPSTVGYFHGAAAADLDNDGLIDFVTSDGKTAPLRFFKNKGNGVFEEQRGKFPSTLVQSGYYTVEVLDVDGDGKLDVLAGGHEFTGSPTVLLTGSGTGTFTTVRTFPAAATGVVLDFVKVGNKLYVGRTTQNYSLLGIQIIDLNTNVATETSRASLLFYWLLPNGNSVISDRTDRPL